MNVHVCLLAKAEFSWFSYLCSYIRILVFKPYLLVQTIFFFFFFFIENKQVGGRYPIFLFLRVSLSLDSLR